MSESSSTLPRIDEDTLFGDAQGRRHAGTAKRQRKLLRKLPVLTDILRADERVLLVTQALSPTPFLEQIFAGAVFNFIKRCLLVFTDQRLLHFPVTMRYRYRGSLAEIRYADVSSLSMSGSMLVVGYRSGRRDKFPFIARRERRKLAALIRDLSLPGDAPPGLDRHHLCPGCRAGLDRGIYRCPQCGLAFRSAAKATWLGLLVPGGGYFYTGHPRLGIVTALVETLLLTALVLSVVEWIGDHDQSFAIVVFAVFLIVEKFVTVYHARYFVDEFMPAGGWPKTGAGS